MVVWDRVLVRVSVVRPCDSRGTGRWPATRETIARHTASPGQDQNSKCEAWVPSNGYGSHTATKLKKEKIINRTGVSWGPSVGDHREDRMELAVKGGLSEFGEFKLQNTPRTLIPDGLLGGGLSGRSVSCLLRASVHLGPWDMPGRLCKPCDLRRRPWVTLFLKGMKTAKRGSAIQVRRGYVTDPHAEPWTPGLG